MIGSLPKRLSATLRVLLTQRWAPLRMHTEIVLCVLLITLFSLVTQGLGSGYAQRTSMVLIFATIVLAALRPLVQRHPKPMVVVMYCLCMALAFGLLAIVPSLLLVGASAGITLVYVVSFGLINPRYRTAFMLLYILGINALTAMDYVSGPLRLQYTWVEFMAASMCGTVITSLGSNAYAKIQERRMLTLTEAADIRLALEARVISQTNALRDQRDLAQSMLQTLGQPMVATNLDGSYRFVNDAFCQLLRRERASFDGVMADSVVAREDLDIFLQVQEQRIQGLSTESEKDLIRSDGTRVHIIARSVPILENGRVTGALVVADDLTKRDETEQALRSARDEAIAASQLKSRFLATISHEIRTPLNAILGMTELALDSPLSEEQRHLLQTVEDAGQSLLQLVNNVLDFSRIQNGQLKPVLEAFEPIVLAGKVAAMFDSRLSARGIALHTEYDTSCARVIGDAARVRQVLVNLMGNAEKFIEAGRITLSVSCAVSPGFAQFKVRDTGIGIDPDSQMRLFTPFQQADSSSTRRYGGTGLGLAICKSLVEMMGGSIGLTSATGQGSTFWFMIPIDPSQSPS